jgi:diaminopimelate decarboxylase
MPGFQSRLGILHCDDVPLDAIARDAGTPVHVYSGALIAARYRELDAAFGGYPHRLHYAIKANATLAVVGRLRELGASADANSGGEIDVALRAGFAPGDIVFTGVGKTRAELERAIALGVRAINAESPGEVERIAALAAAQGARARIAVRINPDVDAGSHPHISTGRAVNKFGLAPDDARALIRGAARQPALEVVGLHVHIGSQVTSPEPVARAVSAVVALAGELRADGITLEHLDVGGGLGIAYAPGQPVMATSDYASAILDVVRPTGLLLLLEPGRWIVGPAGVLVTEVVDLKRGPDDGWFVIVDGGMTDLLRPALYGAHHEIEPVAPRPGPPIVSHVVGPVCETSDTFSGGRPMPPVAVGDLLAIRDTGAYGAVMASNYNRRPMAAEVLVDADRWRVVRRRQTVDEMLQWDAEC